MKKKVKIAEPIKTSVKRLIDIGENEKVELFTMYLKALREACGKKYGVKIKGKL